MNTELPVVTGQLLDEQTSLTLAELCRTCSVHAEVIVTMVEEGILEPSGKDSARWRFTGNNLRRVRTTLRLQRDLGVNLAGAALALDLLEELEALRARLRAFEQSEER